MRPWEQEDTEEVFMHEGFICYMDRTAFHGAWCGYVAVKKDHPAYGKHYDDVDDYVDVHGGLTYAGMNLPRGEEDMDFYWLGFDCAHAYDFCPYMHAGGGKYRTQEYVRDEVKRLAEQLREMT